MRNRISRHLNPGTVIGTIALFVALGGGYATAFSGSGTLQKANKQPIPALTELRSLNGFGILRHFGTCNSGVFSGVNINFENTTSRPVVVHSFNEENGTDATETVGVGENENVITLGAVNTTVRLHLWKGGSGLPKNQVDVVLSGGQVNANPFPCVSTKILALNSVE